jgi:nucleotide-binding universal stress UspA family protein
MKRILVPVDFSAFSETAQRIAVHLAKKTGAKVMLAHCVYTPLEWHRLSVKQQEEYPETVAYTVDAEIKLSKIAGSDLFRDAEVETAVLHGTPYQQIIQQAARYQTDLIVMGTHGNEKADRPFLGSNSQRVIRMATCPVLSVKADAGESNWKNLVFAADFTEAQVKPFERMLPLIRMLDSHVHLLFVNMPARFRSTPQALESLKNFANRFPGTPFSFHIFNYTDLQGGILAFLETAGADWLLMATQDREHAPVYQMGFTEAVLFHSPIPVLSLRAG